MAKQKQAVRKKGKSAAETAAKSPATAEVKKLTNYKQEKPVQLTLFELLLPSEKPYSNTVELYDFVPKYHWGKVERVNGTFLKSLDREFECRGMRYPVSGN